MANRTTSRGQCCLGCTSSSPSRSTFTQTTQEMLGQLFGTCFRKALEPVSSMASRFRTSTAYALTWLTALVLRCPLQRMVKGSVVALSSMTGVCSAGCQLSCIYDIGRMMIEVPKLKDKACRPVPSLQGPRAKPPRACLMLHT